MVVLKAKNIDQANINSKRQNGYCVLKTVFMASTIFLLLRRLQGSKRFATEFLCVAPLAG
jgi:hypothetical protein